MEKSQTAFTQLREPCVQLSITVREILHERFDQKRLVKQLKGLENVLKITQSSLNNKLGDYVYFPLDFILRSHETISFQALDICINCIHLLVERAWRFWIAPNFALRLYSRILPVVDENNPREVPDDVHHSAILCFNALLLKLVATRDGKLLLCDSKNFPFFGQMIYTVLHNLELPSSLNVQLEALATLSTFCNGFPSRDILASKYFPGIISTLTKCVAARQGPMKHSCFLTKTLKLLTEYVSKLFVDAIPDSNQFEKEYKAELKLDGFSYDEWLESAKPRILDVVKCVSQLRHHTNSAVRTELSKFLLSIMSLCSKTLSGTLNSCIETEIFCISTLENVELCNQFNAIVNHESIANNFIYLLDSWMEDLPRMLGNPLSDVRTVYFNGITFAIDASQSLAMNKEILIPQTLCKNLCLAIEQGLQNHNNLKISRITDYTPSVFALTSCQDKSFDKQFYHEEEMDDMIFSGGLQTEEWVNTVSRFIKQDCISKIILHQLMSLVNDLQVAQGNQKVALFWLAINGLRYGLMEKKRECELMSYTTVEMTRHNENRIFSNTVNELLDFAQEILLAYSEMENIDWRLIVLAMETIAIGSVHHKKIIRAALMDILYPILSLVGSGNSDLRNAARKCLITIAQEGGYGGDVSELIVGNSDYIVNSIGQQFCVSSTCTRNSLVLGVIVKLCGFKILPFIDDIMEYIFISMENVDADPQFIESQFLVLNIIIKEAINNPLMKVTRQEIVNRKKLVYKSPDQQECVENFKKIAIRYHESESELQTQRKPEPPNKSSKPNTENSFRDTDGDIVMKENVDAELSLSVQHPDTGLGVISDSAKLHDSKTYRLLYRIAELTQHYLPEPSVAFQQSLSVLLTTVLPTLSKHEDSFYPLINQIWVTISSRLREDSMITASSSIDVIRVLCICAGEFLGSRIDGVWKSLMKVVQKFKIIPSPLLKDNMELMTSEPPNLITGEVSTGNDSTALRVTNNSSNSPYNYDNMATSDPYIAPAKRGLDESFTRLMIAILDFVYIDSEKLSWIIEFLGPILHLCIIARSSANRRNPDYVWLIMNVRVLNHVPNQNRCNVKLNEIRQKVKELYGQKPEMTVPRLSGREFVSII